MRTVAAIDVTCPKCESGPGAMCVYMPWVGRPSPHWWDSDERKRHFANIGNPMQRSHNERYALAYRQEKAMRQAQEREQLRSWLAEYGDIFRE